MDTCTHVYMIIAIAWLHEHLRTSYLHCVDGFDAGTKGLCREDFVLDGRLSEVYSTPIIVHDLPWTCHSLSKLVFQLRMYC